MSADDGGVRFAAKDVSYYISAIRIRNFKNISNEVYICDLQRKNNFLGVYHSIKDDIRAALNFAMCATANELQVFDLKTLKSKADEITYVELTLTAEEDSKDCGVLKRELGDQDEENFYLDGELQVDDVVNGVPYIARTVYMNVLALARCVIAQQIYFYAAANRKLFCNMIPSEQDQLIHTLLNVSDGVRRLNEAKMFIKKTNESVKLLNNEIAKNDEYMNFLREKLPNGGQPAWRPEFIRYITSRLKRVEAERIDKKGKLQNVETELAQIGLNFEQIINQNAAERDAKVLLHRGLLEDIRQLRFYGDQNVPLLKVQIFHFENLIERIKFILENNKTLIAELSRYKAAAESKITFMRSAAGTRRKSNMITEDALMKLYPIYHGSDELDMDRRELELLEKEEELNAIDDRNETFQYFEKFLPQRRMKPMKEPKTIKDICEELHDALKGMFHPNAFFSSSSDMKLLLLKSNIPPSKGFLLYEAFQPKEDQYKNLIHNILFDYKYTIVLYRDDRKSVSERLNKVHPVWFQHVHYLILNELTDRGRLGYIIPIDHWLHHCTYAIEKSKPKHQRQLVDYMRRQKNVICVDTHEEVQQEFEQKSQKYVASLDGQLIYARSAMGIDVLMYFKPGKATKEMHFPDACQRLKNATSQVGEWLSTIVETENIPRQLDPGTVNVDDLRTEVAQLKLNSAQNQQTRIDQMEILRRRMNEPYDMLDVQNYDNALLAEQGKLNDINTRIMKLQDDIAEDEANQRNWTEQIRSIKKFIDYKTQMDTHLLAIIEHNKIIKENIELKKEGDDRKVFLAIEIEHLKNDIKNLKYRTIRWVMVANRQNILVTEIGCVTTPPNLFAQVTAGTYIEPMQISTTFGDMVDTFDDDVSYGPESWFEKLTMAEEVNTELTTRRIALRLSVGNTITEYDQLKVQLKAVFDEFDIEMNNIVTRIIRMVKRYIPSYNIDIQFHFKYKFQRDVKHMVRLKQNGSAIGLENVSYLNQARIYWIVFAAFHLYSSAPFLFIDLTDLSEPICNDLVGILVEHFMSKLSQLFFNCYHLHELQFADLQFATNKVKLEPDDADAADQDVDLHTVQIMKYDSSVQPTTLRRQKRRSLTRLVPSPSPSRRRFSRSPGSMIHDHPKSIVESTPVTTVTTTRLPVAGTYGRFLHVPGRLPELSSPSTSEVRRSGGVRSPTTPSGSMIHDHPESIVPSTLVTTRLPVFDTRRLFETYRKFDTEGIFDIRGRVPDKAGPSSSLVLSPLATTATTVTANRPTVTSTPSLFPTVPTTSSAMPISSTSETRRTDADARPSSTLSGRRNRNPNTLQSLSGMIPSTLAATATTVTSSRRTVASTPLQFPTLPATALPGSLTISNIPSPSSRTRQSSNEPQSPPPDGPPPDVVTLRQSSNEPQSPSHDGPPPDGPPPDVVTLRQSSNEPQSPSHDGPPPDGPPPM